jgi:drug/metabolite transporter (DMT)-like permease
MLAAVIFIWVWAAIQKQTGETITAVRKQPKTLGLLALGALLGPVLGVSASLLAIQHAEIGVASTLMALPPVIVLPVSYFVFKEKVGWQAIAGTLLAIVGVAVLFLA